MKRKCYFCNVGVTFDNTNKQELKDCWNNNDLCCKSDLCNGLWCENYSIEFNKENAEQYIKNYVLNGCKNTYGYIKEVEVDLPEELWLDIEKELIEDYSFSGKKEIEERGFIPFDLFGVIDDFTSYWEQPDVSYYKNKDILKNTIQVKCEHELNKDIIEWINSELYQTNKKENNELEY